VIYVAWYFVNSLGIKNGKTVDEAQGLVTIFLNP
jgi:hypothetical protein